MQYSASFTANKSRNGVFWHVKPSIFPKPDFAGPDYAIELATRPKLAKWLEVVMAVDAVKATLAEPEALCGQHGSVQGWS